MCDELEKAIERSQSLRGLLWRAKRRIVPLNPHPNPRHPGRRNQATGGVFVMQQLRVWFWRNITIFAYRRWAGHPTNGEKPWGLPGYRDPENYCEFYDPRGGMTKYGYIPDCCGDGHALCRQCVNLKPDDPEDVTFDEAVNALTNAGEE